ELLGRADDQVKIRGFRVETGEVAAALRAVPGVADAAVLPWTDEGGLQSLVVVPLAALPLTTGGKVDRARLPAPGPASAPGAGDGVAPRTAAEDRAARVVAGVLGRSAVGVT